MTGDISGQYAADTVFLGGEQYDDRDEWDDWTGDDIDQERTPSAWDDLLPAPNPLSDAEPF